MVMRERRIVTPVPCKTIATALSDLEGRRMVSTHEFHGLASSRD
jgi:hypothetical protein